MLRDGARPRGRARSRAQADHYDPDHYYAVRDADPAKLSPVERAAHNFLNKTGFNGLYRVIRSGKFNVPFGRYAKPLICDEKNLLACSRRSPRSSSWF